MKKVNCCLESLRRLGPKVRETISSHIQVSNNLDLFKYVIKQRNPDFCTCRLCKVYIQHVEYIKGICGLHSF